MSRKRKHPKLINDSKVKEHLSIHYEMLSKEAGTNNDHQDITTLVVKDKDQETLQNYIKLHNRETGQNSN